MNWLAKRNRRKIGVIICFEFSSVQSLSPSVQHFMTQWTAAWFPGVSADKESACNSGDLGLIPGLGRSPGEGKGHPLQCSGLENSMDCIVHGVAKSPTTERLSLPPSPFHVIWCLLSHVGSHIPHGGRLNCGPQRYPHPKGRCGTHIWWDITQPLKRMS